MCDDLGTCDPDLYGDLHFFFIGIKYINYFDLLPIQGLATSTTFVKVTVESVNTFQ
jgi:hypothetical protein